MSNPGEDFTMTDEVVIMLAYEGKEEPADTPADVLLPLTDLGSV